MEYQGQSSNTHPVDEPLPFGAHQGPEIFNSITEGVEVIRGVPVFRSRLLVYLDDFIVTSGTKEQYTPAKDKLRRLLRHLHFAINYDKTVSATRSLTFFGIRLNSMTMTAGPPQSKKIAIIRGTKQNDDGK